MVTLHPSLTTLHSSLTQSTFHITTCIVFPYQPFLCIDFDETVDRLLEEEERLGYLRVMINDPVGKCMIHY